MGRKRRSNGDHQVGDSSPGTVGDKRPARDSDADPSERAVDGDEADEWIPESEYEESNQHDSEDDSVKLNE